MSDYGGDALPDRMKLMEEERASLPARFSPPTAKVSEDNGRDRRRGMSSPALSLAKTKCVAELVKWADGSVVYGREPTN